jgi:hypothetical protein
MHAFSSGDPQMCKCIWIYKCENIYIYIYVQTAYLRIYAHTPIRNLSVVHPFRGVASRRTDWFRPAEKRLALPFLHSNSNCQLFTKLTVRVLLNWAHLKTTVLHVKLRSHPIQSQGCVTPWSKNIVLTDEERHEGIPQDKDLT